MNLQIQNDQLYKDWLRDIKAYVRKAQIKAALQVNKELMEVYWTLGQQIVDKQKQSQWGDALIPQLSQDLIKEFPGINGFSRSNLYYIRKWVTFWQAGIVQQAVGQLEEGAKAEPVLIQQLVGLIPWGHHIKIVTQCKRPEEALFYLRATINNNWSRAVLTAQMESKLYERSGTTINNFDATLSVPQSDLAKETLKNPYNFEFLSLGDDFRERDLENGLIHQIQKLLMEMGQGFAFLGKQYPLRVGNSDFFLDLLFYHTKLRCYIIGELKITEFQPEYVGKLNFYLNAVDAQLKHPTDQPSIGILLCKASDKIVVEYSLKNLNSPLGVAAYHLTKALPNDLKSSLPSIEDLEKELKNTNDHLD